MRTTPLLRTHKHPAPRRPVTSSLRHRNQSTNLSVNIFIASLLALAIACDVTMAIPPRNVLTKNELAVPSEKLPCRACKQLVTSSRLYDVIKRLAASMDAKRRRLNSDSVLSLQKRRRAISLKLKILNPPPADEYTPPDTETLLRHKRLAEGDRRLTNLYSKTGFLLGLSGGNRVTGFRTYSPHTLVEIRSAQQGSIVSMYFPNADRYLAMNRRGRLYGRRTYLQSECNFREEAHGGYVTYSTFKVGRHRRRRSGSKYFVGIGREGNPRKGNRIDWSSEAALFVHSSP